MKPVLLFRPGGLGDILAALPSFRLLRRIHPGAKLLLASREPEASWLRAAGVADEARSIDDPEWADLYAAPERGPAVGGRLQFAAWSWFLKEPGEDFRAGWGRSFGGEGRVIVYDPGLGRPLSRAFFDLTALAAGRAVSGADYEACARLPAPSRDSAAGHPPPRPYAVIHPGSGGRNKCWPLGLFLDVADDLAACGLEGFLVTGPAEGWLEGELDSRPLPPAWRRLSNPGLADLAGLCAGCAVFLGNDSGVAHLAAAAGARVLALFRDENLPLWRPFGRAAVLHAPDVSAISVDEVRGRVRALAGLA